MEKTVQKKWTIHRLNVEQATDLRLDQYLAAAAVDLSRTLAKKIIDLGGVHINGRRVRSASTALTQGDAIEVYLDHLEPDPWRIDEADILYQDKDLIALNKPAGIDTQPTHARYKGTLYEALNWYLRDPFHKQKKVSLGMVQRLDRGTSGVIVFSIAPRAHKNLTRIFLEHQLQKRYLALVAGQLPEAEGEIRSLLARSRKENRVHSVASGGKLAITRFRLVEQFAEAALVELDLVTGRSHQIRAHMAEQGCPLLGDLRYGGPAGIAGMPLERPLLHAWQLQFAHPVSGQPLALEAEVPADMTLLLHHLRDECL